MEGGGLTPLSSVRVRHYAMWFSATCLVARRTVILFFSHFEREAP